jgi:hypothetical protein
MMISSSTIITPNMYAHTHKLINMQNYQNIYEDFTIIVFVIQWFLKPLENTSTFGFR